MSAQDEYNREVVAKARDIVAAAGLDRLPLTQALGQIAHAFRARGIDSTLAVIDGQDPVAAIEVAASGKYWQMAKGKVRSGEPLYGAAIIEPGTNKIVEIGEADSLITAIRSMRPETELT